MKKKRVRRYSKVQKAIVYIRDIGRGYVTVYDPESLRKACWTVSNYLENLEMNATEGAKRKASHDAESILGRSQSAQFTFFDERTPDYEYTETT